MKKNKLIAVTAAVFAFQLLLSVCLCGVQVYRMKNAETFSFRISQEDLDLSGDGLYFNINDMQEYAYGYEDAEYIPLEKDENGFAVLDEATDQKPSSPYLLCSEAMTYSSFMTYNYKIVSHDIGSSLTGAYLTVRIYNGKIIHIDGVYNESGLLIEIRA